MASSSHSGIGGAPVQFDAHLAQLLDYLHVTIGTIGPLSHVACILHPQQILDVRDRFLSMTTASSHRADDDDSFSLVKLRA